MVILWLLNQKSLDIFFCSILCLFKMFFYRASLQNIGDYDSLQLPVLVALNNIFLFATPPNPFSAIHSHILTSWLPPHPHVILPLIYQGLLSSFIVQLVWTLLVWFCNNLKVQTKFVSLILSKSCSIKKADVIHNWMTPASWAPEYTDCTPRQWDNQRQDGVNSCFLCLPFWVDCKNQTYVYKWQRVTLKPEYDDL